MKKRIKNITTALAIVLLLPSCKQSTVEGIFIADTIYENQNYVTNKKLRQAIQRTLEKDPKALVELVKFPCGGAAGCYDLGFIMTQIIYKMGEKNFIVMAERLGEEEINELKGLIEVGIEYGDNNKDGKTDNKRFEYEFPKLYELLKN